MNRDVVLVVYAILLGWCANSWWREEKERIAWSAANKAHEQVAFAASMRQPAAETSAGST